MARMVGECMWDGLDCIVYVENYTRGALAVGVESRGGEPVCMFSVNLPGRSGNLPAGHFYAKDFDENESVAASLLAADVAKPVSEMPSAESGFCRYPVWRLNNPIPSTLWVLLQRSQEKNAWAACCFDRLEWAEQFKKRSRARYAAKVVGPFGLDESFCKQETLEFLERFAAKCEAAVKQPPGPRREA